MKFYNKDNELIIDVEVDDSSYSQRQIMSDNTLTLNYSLPDWLEIPLGAWCEFKGTKYYLYKPENFKKNHTRNWEYTLVLETIQAILRNLKFRSIQDTPPKLKFSLTGGPAIFLKLLVDNLNMADSGWSVGNTIEAEDHTLDFSNQSCMDALSSISDAFKTEWNIEGKTISLGKVEKNKENPVSLAYGKGEGLKPGVGRSNYDNSSAVTRLYVTGGTRNVDAHTYGAESLLLPKNKTLEYKDRIYKTDEYGTFIERADKPFENLIEGCIDLSNIYPKWEGTVTDVIAVDDTKALYDFKDSNIPDELDFNNYLLPKTKMLVVFQTGLLSGKQFEINKYDHINRRFELVSIEDGSYPLPKAPLVPETGDKYGVFDISLPQYYIDLASQKMFEEAARYMYDNEDPRFSFKGELDAIFAKQNWETIGGYLDPGCYIHFTDIQFQKDPVLIRITGIKEYVNNPYAPEIELSNVTASNTFGNKMAEITNSEVTGDRKQKENFEFTKRRWRDAKETQQNMFDALVDYFSEGITPLTVETMQLLVGNPALQFIFLETKESKTEIDPGINWNNNENKMYVLAGGVWIKHMTLGIDFMGGEPSPEKYHCWKMPEAWHSGALAEEDNNKVFFLYAKCSSSAETGTYFLTTEQIKMEQYLASGYYHFLIGILNSELEDIRSYTDLYGFTEILPGQITGRRFQSTDGYQFWDFTKKQFQIGDQYTGIDWNVRNQDKLTIRGGIIQDPGGNKDGITVWRGEWNSSNTYYLGNEVSYNGSTFRYVNSSPTSGNIPTNINYWVEMSGTAADGKVVTVTASTQVFRYSNGFSGTPTPSTIRINASVQNISNPTYQWYYGPGDGSWQLISSSTLGYLDISYNNNVFTNNATTIRCLVNGQYYDQITLVRIADGNDAYTVVLDNEAHTVVCDSNGNPVSGEIGFSGKARTKVTVFRGATQLSATGSTPSSGQFQISFNSSADLVHCSAQITSTNDGIYIDYVSAVENNAQVFLNINCEGKVTLRKEFSIAKSKQGAKGENGELGATMVFRGEYSSTETYYGTSDRRDVVAVNYGTSDNPNYRYYMAVTVKGIFSAIAPGNTAYWMDFGTNFSSVATGLLFAKEALIAGWNFSNERIWSQNNNVYLNGANDGKPNFWAGSSDWSKASIRIWGYGLLEAENAEISGVLKGVTGSFVKLTNIDPSGNEKGTIYFSDGRMTFEGDMQHQGYIKEKSRGYRFLTSNLWCRGTFGSVSLNALYIVGSTAYYYTNGLSDNMKEIITLEQATSSSSEIYYKIPLYGTTGDAAGFPVDLLILNSSNSSNYELSGLIGKKVTVINANDRASSASFIFCNGKKVALNGGALRDFVNIYGFCNPSVSDNILGKGWLAGAEYDNNW